MTFLEHIDHLNYLLQLLKANKLIKVDAIATKFNCSPKTVYRMIDELRNQGHIIKYDRPNKKYFLEK